MTKKTASILINIFLVLGMATIIFFYFFTITNPPKTKSNPHPKHKIQIRYTHSLYEEPFKQAIKSIKKDGHTQIKVLPIYSILFSIIGLYLIWVIIQKNYFKRPRINLKISPFHILLLFFGFFSITYLWWVNYFDLYYQLADTPIYLKVLSITSIILLVFLILVSTGFKIIKKVFPQQKNLLLIFLNSTAIGIIAIYLLNFALASFHQLNQLSIVICFALLAIIARQEIITWLKIFFKRNIHIVCPYYSLKISLYFYFLLFAAFNFLLLTRPIPVGHDDIESYINTVNQLSLNHSHVYGFMAYPWQLFLSTFQLLSRNMTTVFWATATSGILSTLCVYYLSRTFQKIKKFKSPLLPILPLLTAVLFYTMPMVRYMSSWDTKVDLPGLFFSLIALINFLGFIKKRQNEHLFLSFLFLGMAFTIKYTNIYLPVGFTIYLLVEFIKYKKLRPKFATITICAISFLAAFTPFLILNLSSHGSTIKQFANKSDLILTSKDNNKPLVAPPLNSIEKVEVIDQLKIATKQSQAKELSRYMEATKSFWANYLLLPITVTINNANVLGQLADISYLPLIFAGLFLIKRPKTTSKYYPLLIILLVSSYFLWALTSHGIIWYGIILPVFSLLLLGDLLLNYRNNNLILNSLYILISLWVAVNLFTLPFMNYWPKNDLTTTRNITAYAKGAINQSTYISLASPDAALFENLKIDKSKVIYVGSGIRYFLSSPEAKLIDLPELSKITYFNNDLLRNTMDRLNIDAIIIDKREFNPIWAKKNIAIFHEQIDYLFYYINLKHPGVDIKVNRSYIVIIKQK